MAIANQDYDCALERFHRTGPEYDGYLSNHGPMVVEVLSRLGRADEIEKWTDGYLRRLEPLPAAGQGIDPQRWEQALGDRSRTRDWIDLMQREVSAAPWADVLARWWPRLLPGITGGATHGVIRIGHSVQGLLAAETPPRIAELAHALALWAACWHPVPPLAPAGHRSAAQLVAVLPRIARQEAGFRDRAPQLDDSPEWRTQANTLSAPATESEIPQALADLVDAVVAMYPHYAHAEPTMLVHAATAPNAVAMALPALPTGLWRASFDAAWTASAAVIAAYAPVTPDERSPAPTAQVDMLDRAIAHGGEHVIKFADTALASYQRTGQNVALAAISTAIELDA